MPVEPLTSEETTQLREFAEGVWQALVANDLGGFSGINRPFYLVWKFREAIERFGRRDTGLTHASQPVAMQMEGKDG